MKAAEFYQAIGVPERVGKHWAASGLLPVAERHPGYGAHREFDDADVERGRILAGLHRFGVTLKKMRGILDAGVLRNGVFSFESICGITIIPLPCAKDDEAPLRFFEWATRQSVAAK